MLRVYWRHFPRTTSKIIGQVGGSFPLNLLFAFQLCGNFSLYKFQFVCINYFNAFKEISQCTLMKTTEIYVFLNSYVPDARIEILLDLWFGSENSERFYVIYVTVTRSNLVSQDYFSFPRIRFWARHIRGWGQITIWYMVKTARLTIIIMIWIRLLYTLTCWSLIYFFLLIICKTKKNI